MAISDLVLCHGTVQGAVLNVTQVFEDFATSCYADVSYRHKDNNVFSSIPVPCEQGLAAAGHTHTAQLCLGSTNETTRLMPVPEEDGGYYITSGDRPDWIFWAIYTLLVISSTTAVVADIIDVRWRSGSSGDSNTSNSENLAQARSAPTLFIITTVSGFCILVIYAIHLGASRSNICISCTAASVEYITPSYSGFGMQCSAQLAFQLPDETTSRRIIDDGCKAGLDAAEKTKSVEICLRKSFGYWQADWIKQARDTTEYTSSPFCQRWSIAPASGL